MDFMKHDRVVNVVTGDVARFEEELPDGFCRVYVTAYGGTNIYFKWETKFVSLFYDEYRESEEFVPVVNV